MTVADYATSGNTTVGGINIATGTSPSNVDNALRKIVDDIGEGLAAGRFGVNLNASNLTSGTVPDARVASTNLNASNLTSGAVPVARLTDVNASNLTSGTVPDARLRLSAAIPFAGGVDSVTDIDTLTSPGAQKYLYGATNAHLPSASYYYIYNFQFADAGQVTQLAIPYGNDSMYRRHSYAGVFTGWKTIPTLDENDARYAQLSGATFIGDVIFGGYLRSYSGNLVIGTNAAYSIYLRPNGHLSPTNEFIIPSSGAPTTGGSTIHHDGNASRGAPDWVLEDQKASGTNGGTATSGAWFTRTLNTEVRDPLGLVTLSSNQFVSTVDGWVEFDAPFWSTGGSQARLYNVTDSVEVKTGSSNYANAAGATHTSLGGAAIVAGKTYRIEWRVATTKSTDGQGVAANVGSTEVYARVKFWRS